MNLLLPPGRGGGRTCLGPVDPTRLPPSRAPGSARSARQAGMGVECWHSAGEVSTPTPTLPLPGGGSQKIGRTDFGGGQAKFRIAKGLVSRDPPRPLARPVVRGETTEAPRTREVGCRGFQRTAQRTGPYPCWSPRLEPPLGGRVPRLQSALRQIGRDEEAELCEAAARQGSGERHVQRMPEPRRRDLGTSGLSSPADT